MTVSTLDRRRLPGLLLPGAAGYDDARRAWNLAVDQRPAAAAAPTSAGEVAELVRAAGRAGLRVAVQATGHGARALGPLDEALLVRTGGLRGVHVDPARRRARVAAGACWGEVTAAAAEHGLAAHAGAADDVGVVGYLLGGGIGWLARRYGLAAEDVVAIELVTANGALVRVGADDEPELFWALRGGGGGLGVVTAVELRLHPIVAVQAGALIWPAARTGEVLRAWRGWCATVPDEITSVGRVVWLPPAAAAEGGHPIERLGPGAFVVVEVACLAAAESADPLLAPLRALDPALDTVATVGAPALGGLHMDPSGPTALLSDHVLLDELPDAALDALAGAVLDAGGSPLASVELRQLGGALAVPRADHGALGTIDAAFALLAVAHVAAADDAATRAAERRVAEVAAAVAPWGQGRRYLNFADRAEDSARAFRDQSFRRLQAVKAAWDPQNVFLAGHGLAATGSRSSPGGHQPGGAP
ncbi:FAD-binding protein [Patulibacter defluvii]|uniref:FAD-binding protein n=1 Tax=Patulibacter defluvii TaxID=3095358 RepID=UPI002A759303|nr:FAD-binding protein [Patulibacter sp. DM4]